jgi:8-oxo-dGTP pyrophosphatase MutT (NUDIX family)
VTHSVSVAAVVTDESGRILVIQRRDNGAWEIPGGILERDETVPAGLRREVEEETGLVVEAGPLTGVYKNMRLGVVALVLRARLVGGDARATEESAAVDWWTPAEVERRMSMVVAVKVLDAFRVDGPAVRHHDGTAFLSTR